MFGEPMNDYMFTDDESKVFGSGADFVAGSTTGVAIFDDFWNLYGSSKSDLLLVNYDYTAYDSTQGQVNSREYQKTGLIKSLKALGLDAPYGPYPGGMPEVVDILMSEGITHNIIFQSGTIPPEFYERTFPGIEPNSLTAEAVNEQLIIQDIPARLINVESLRSGELITLASNTLNNRANFRAFFDLYHPEFMYLLRLRIQGDDSNMIMKMVPGAVFTSEKYEELVSTFQGVSNANGLLVNKNKVLTRLSLSEFLQVTSWFGVFCPKPVVQAVGSEKVSRTIGITDQIIADISKNATLVERGLDEALMRRKSIWTWAWKRSLRNSRERDYDDSYFMPCAGLFLPGTSKGCDMLPWTTLGPNNSTVLVAFLDAHPEWKEMMERISSIMNVPVPNLRREVARKINSDAPGIYPRDPMKIGRQYLQSTMKQSRIAGSEEAYHYLRDNNIIDLGDKRYSRYPVVYLDTALSQNKNLRELDFESKFKAVHLMIDNAIRAVRRPYNTDCEWVSAFEYAFEDEVETLLPPEITPFDGMDWKIRELHRYVGYNQSRHVFDVRISKLLSILYQDPDFRRDIQEDQLIAILARPNVLSSTTAVFKTLIAIGAREDLAAIVANKFSSAAGRYAALSSISGMSLTGPCLNSLDLSREGMLRLTGPFYITTPDLRDLMTLQCAAMSILHYFRTGKVVKVRPIISKTSVQKARKFLLPSKLIGDYEEIAVFAGVTG
jgi:hypothetical protein